MTVTIRSQHRTPRRLSTSWPHIALRLALSLAVLATTLWTGAGAAPASPEDPRCPASASICLYNVPVSVENARDACFRAERQARDIPGDMDAYLAWFEQHRGTPEQLDWSRAHTACRHRYTQPGGMWNWSALVYIGAR